MKILQLLIAARGTHFISQKYKAESIVPGSGLNSTTFLNGDSINVISIQRSNDVCYGEPLISGTRISFVITASGRIVNFTPQFEWSCPYYMLDVVRHISQLGVVNAAKRKGNPVNVKWTLEVRSNFQKR